MGPKTMTLKQKRLARVEEQGASSSNEMPTKWVEELIQETQEADEISELGYRDPTDIASKSNKPHPQDMD